jgi:hypothetical protein
MQTVIWQPKEVHKKGKYNLLVGTHLRKFHTYYTAKNHPCRMEETKIPPLCFSR